jgi:TetR/AcrR family transcriptional regulator, transcriptional repressor for nem operon
MGSNATRATSGETMARYSKEHKEVTRRRILERAGRRFKRDGIDGSGIATLMADAGLTNGAFYAHFASKEDLVAAVVGDQLRGQQERSQAVLSDRAGFEQFVREYLSPAHRDSPDEGCPSAALLDEIARASDATKRAYTDGLLAMIDDVAALIESPDRGSARVRALSIFASMFGTLQLSRALADRKLADDVLAQGVENVLALS